MPAPTRHSRHAPDLDEIAPGRFMINNSRIMQLLKGEGTIAGRLFEQTSWRREGLLARLRERELRVRTLDDRIAALPAPPDDPPPIEAIGWRALATPLEQFSHFDLQALGWHAVAPTLREGMPGVALYGGWVLRRRKGRGNSSYYLALHERAGGIGLRPLGETQALLSGFAQALAHDPRPLLAERRGDRLLLPTLELPPAYRATLALLTGPNADEPLVDERAWPLAQDLFGRLGIRLTIASDAA